MRRASAVLAAAMGAAAVLGLHALALAVGGDTCATATVVPWASIDPAGYSDLGTTGLNNNVGVTCGVDGSDVFYAFTCARTCYVDITTCAPGTPSTTDTVLALKQASACVVPVAFACNDDSPCVPNGPIEPQSTLHCVQLIGGIPYVVQVDNRGSTASAPYELDIKIAGFDLTESLSKLTGTGTVVARDVGSPYLHTPGSASAPVLYYTVGGCVPSGVLLAARRGTDIEFWF